MKLVTLLALITAHRVQTYSLIKISNIDFSESKIQIRIPDRIKTSGVNKVQPLLNIPFYENNPALCTASALGTYLEKTKPVRTCDNLFISYVAPHEPVTVQTISRWIKLSLQASGVSKEFSAHSTRYAATSKAARLGVNIETIKQTAGWSKKSETFARFYNRPFIDMGSFAQTVLSNHKN